MESHFYETSGIETLEQKHKFNNSLKRSSKHIVIKDIFVVKIYICFYNK